MYLYKKDFCELIKITEEPHDRSFVTWKFINLYFEQQTKFCFVCKKWALADEIKKALNISIRWKYLTIRDIYRYTDLLRVSSDVIEPKEVITDYYSKESEGIINTLQNYLLTEEVLPALVSDSGSEYSDEPVQQYQPAPALISESESDYSSTESESD